MPVLESGSVMYLIPLIHFKENQAQSQFHLSVGNYKISSLLKIPTQQRRYDERSEEFS